MHNIRLMMLVVVWMGGFVAQEGGGRTRPTVFETSTGVLGSPFSVTLLGTAWPEPTRPSS